MVLICLGIQVLSSGGRNVSSHTKDLEFCRDGGANGLTLVGVSFSMEWRRWGDRRLSDWGVDDTGRKFGGTGGKKKNELNTWGSLMIWTNYLQYEARHRHSHPSFPPQTRVTCPSEKETYWSCCALVPPGNQKITQSRFNLTAPQQQRVHSHLYF